MAFNLTRYIYPIESKIVLSKSLCLELDNPRTEDEITFIKKTIQKSLQLENPLIDDIEKDLFLRAAFGIDNLKQYLKTYDKDCYAYKFLESQKKEKVIDTITKSWIILRFTEKNLFNNYKEDSFQLLDKLYKNEDDEYITNFTTSLDYSYILSLLIHDEDRYRGFSFLLFKTPTEIFYPSDRYKIYRAIENFKDYNGLLEHSNREHYWTYWLDVKDTIFEEAAKLETLISQTDKIKPTKSKKLPISKRESSHEKLLYIGSILKTVDHETKNLKLKLLLLTSIIEFLVTRNPDMTKYNVEDSISKQFKLKSAILIYQNISGANLDEIKTSLEKIYKQRSEVAHGNYSTKNDPAELLDSVFNLYDFIKAMIIAYLKDKDFVDYLKDN